MDPKQGMINKVQLQIPNPHIDTRGKKMVEHLINIDDNFIIGLTIMIKRFESMKDTFMKIGEAKNIYQEPNRSSEIINQAIIQGQNKIKEQIDKTQKKYTDPIDKLLKDLKIMLQIYQDINKININVQQYFSKLIEIFNQVNFMTLSFYTNEYILSETIPTKM